MDNYYETYNITLSTKITLDSEKEILANYMSRNNQNIDNPSLERLFATYSMRWAEREKKEHKDKIKQQLSAKALLQWGGCNQKVQLHPSFGVSVTTTMTIELLNNDVRVLDELTIKTSRAIGTLTYEHIKKDKKPKRRSRFF